ncbi:alpha/beta hydrolase [Hymenobacter aerilatus]|uniref:Alpha/beta hydrolase n=1 Tax=Hymenobacter aerilatus TaxID=2932251 RepID=A0A8T9SRW3_9BACT|nr:alpha/beta hydrolase [Hymenobacter aerilatus]UOR03764.1 alpha/beta hydrolase [Hymenobacter aerilatus]
MNFLTVGHDDRHQPIRLHYVDLGEGDPIVLLHGYPASLEMWEPQLLELPRYGVRVVAFSRRGFGHSDKPWHGYDYDTFADDLKTVLDTLDLQNVTLVGFSMGGGEVARYMRRHQGARVSKVVFASSVTPYLFQDEANPAGLSEEDRTAETTRVRTDRFAFLRDYNRQFYSSGLLHASVGSASLQWMQQLCNRAAPWATEACIAAFGTTDFRADLAFLSLAVPIPTLVIHGGHDELAAADAGGRRMWQYVPQAAYVEYDGAPHGLFLTDKDRFNRDLLNFARYGLKGLE